MTNARKQEWIAKMSGRLTDEDLVAIEDASRRASPAPWILAVTPEEWGQEEIAANQTKMVREGGARAHFCIHPEDAEAQEARVTAFCGNGPTSEANARFIEVAVVAVPMLVREIRRLRALSPVESPGEDDWSHRCPECGASVCSHVVLMARRAAAPREVEEVRAAAEAMLKVWELEHPRAVVEPTSTVSRLRAALARLSSSSGEAPERGDGEAPNIEAALRALPSGPVSCVEHFRWKRALSDALVAEIHAEWRMLTKDEQNKVRRLDASPRGTGTEGGDGERVCPACGETPSAARARWAKIVARPDFDPEGAPTPCDHAALRRGTEGGK